MSDRLTVFPSRNPQGTLGDSVDEIQNKKFPVDVTKKMCSGRLRRRASVHELFMDYPTCS
jgi:hypothetical protein